MNRDQSEALLRGSKTEAEWITNLTRVKAEFGGTPPAPAPKNAPPREAPFTNAEYDKIKAETRKAHGW